MIEMAYFDEACILGMVIEDALTAVHQDATALEAIIAPVFDPERPGHERINGYRVTLWDKSMGSVAATCAFDHILYPRILLQHLLQALEQENIKAKMMEAPIPALFCRDCGSPMFVGPTGAMVHAEDSPPPKAALH
jgi:hypothetical protein